MKTRIRALLLAAMFVVSLLPVMSMADDVAEVGTSEDLKNAIAAGGEIKLSADITVEGTENIKIQKDLVIDGAKEDGTGVYTITFTGNNQCFRVGEDTDTVLDVNFKNLKIVNSNGRTGRCINIRNNSKVALDNVELDTTAGSGNNQPLTVGGSVDGTKLTVKNSKLSGGSAGYGIQVYVQSEVDVINTEITCYGGAIYMKKGSANSVVNVTDGSVLNGINIFTREGFAVVVCCDDNIEINVVDSTVKAQCTDETSAQYAFSYQPDIEETVEPANSNISVSGNSTLELSEQSYLSYVNGTISAEDGIEIVSATITGAGASDELNQKLLQESLPSGSAVDADGNVYVVPPAYAGPVMNWVKVNAADNGVVKSGPLAASAGATVTLYPKAAEGYVLDTVSVLDASGNAVTVEGLKFQIPAGGVTVSATFKLAE